MDVVVDLRKGSPTYGKYEVCELTEENHRQFFVPKGMAAIAWDDPDLNIKWPISVADVILSEKDKHHPRLNDFESPFVFNL